MFAGLPAQYVKESNGKRWHSDDHDCRPSIVSGEVISENTLGHNAEGSIQAGQPLFPPANGECKHSGNDENDHEYRLPCERPTTVDSTHHDHEETVKTDQRAKDVDLPAKCFT